MEDSLKEVFICTLYQMSLNPKVPTLSQNFIDAAKTTGYTILQRQH